MSNPEPQVANTYQSATISAAQNGTRTLLPAPGAGKQIWVYGLMAVASDAGTALFLDGDDNAHTGTITLAKGHPLELPISANGLAPWWKCATNTALLVRLSENLDLSGSLLYAVVDVGQATSAQPAPSPSIETPSPCPSPSPSISQESPSPCPSPSPSVSPSASPSESLPGSESVSPSLSPSPSASEESPSPSEGQPGGGEWSYLDPNADGENTYWYAEGAPYRYMAVDDGVRAPAMPNINDYIWITSEDEGYTKLGLQTPSGGATEIRAYAYCDTWGGGAVLKVQVGNGNSLPQQTLISGYRPPDWYYAEWTGNWSESQLQQLLQQITFEKTGTDGEATVYACYVAYR